MFFAGDKLEFHLSFYLGKTCILTLNFVQNFFKQ